MIILVCVDDAGGMLFNHRRQSRDRVVQNDMLELAAGSRLWMNSYSVGQFPEDAVPEIRVSDDFLEEARAGEYCFVEDADLSACRVRMEQVILYRWNRRYPADVYLDPTLLEGFVLTETSEFPGFSHEKITRECWGLQK
ncbi:MAG: ribonuclease Z [Clostridiales bacterium]|nr:ribonuclease Z [Clostridiales bacterium]